MSAPSSAAPVPIARVRVDSVDVVRGVIMIIMALDHTRDFFGVFGANPTNLETTTVQLFLTRWITHVCAPTFFLLTGTGAYLSLGKQSVGQLARFLVTRGIWLIFLDLVVLRCLAIQFNVDFILTISNVLWALGWSMIALGAVVHLRPAIIGAMGVAMIATHNLLDGIRSANPLWTFLHSPNVIVPVQGHTVFLAYPVIPWIGVTAAGFALGQIYRWPAERRRRWLYITGVSLTVAFLALRFANIYGDPVRWTTQPSPAFTVLSFLNTNKYPPSLLFLLMTMGPVLVLLGGVDGRTPALLNPAVVFGRVPMFYFLVHFVLIHAIAVGVCYAKYGGTHWMFESPSFDRYPFTPPPGWGFSLPVVYSVWATVVLAMYLPSRWFGALKRRRHDWWLSYL